MSSDCLGLLLGLTLPLQPLSCHTGLTYLNEMAVEHVFLFWICVKVLGVKVASGCLWVGNTMTSFCFLDAWWFSQHFPCTFCGRQRLCPWILEQRRPDGSMLYRLAGSYTGQQGSRGRRFSLQSKALLLCTAQLGYPCNCVLKGRWAAAVNPWYRKASWRETVSENW